MGRKLGILVLAWTAVITALHIRWNVGWEAVRELATGKRELRVGFLPVT